MFSYEALLETLQSPKKSLKDAVSAATRHQKALQKNLDMGNLTEAAKNLAALSEAIGQMQAQTDAVQQEIAGFDTREYFASGDFTQQLLDSCREKGVDVKGEKGVYEMFPFKVRILGDAEHPGEVYMNRKKLPSFRPAYIAETIRLNQAKLFDANFKTGPFLAELAEAYEVTCLKSGVRVGSTQTLTKIYRNLVPTARARKDYDMQAYAYDLARLYEAGPDDWVTKNGTRYTFGTSRDGASGIRVLSRTGVESYINTLCSLHTAVE